MRLRLKINTFFGDSTIVSLQDEEDFRILIMILNKEEHIDE